MTVSLDSLNPGKVEADMSNSDWAAMVRVALAFNEPVPIWNGCHDGQIYSPVQLRLIAKRVRQISQFCDVLENLADEGGAKLS